MATGAQQSSSNRDPIAARQNDEPSSRRYSLTAGPVLDLTRPGELEGSTTGAAGDTGRQGTVGLGVDLQAIAPHTGF